MGDNRISGNIHVIKNISQKVYTKNKCYQILVLSIVFSFNFLTVGQTIESREIFDNVLDYDRSLCEKELTNWRPIFPLYRNQLVYSLSKSINWFPHEGKIEHWWINSWYLLQRMYTSKVNLFSEILATTTF